jgi:hypothetical protein
LSRLKAASFDRTVDWITTKYYRIYHYVPNSRDDGSLADATLNPDINISAITHFIELQKKQSKNKARNKIWIQTGYKLATKNSGKQTRIRLMIDSHPKDGRSPPPQSLIKAPELAFRGREFESAIALRDIESRASPQFEQKAH